MQLLRFSDGATMVDKRWGGTPDKVVARVNALNELAPLLTSCARCYTSDKHDRQAG